MTDPALGPTLYGSFPAWSAVPPPTAEDRVVVLEALLVKIAAVARCNHTPLTRIQAISEALREYGV